MSAPRLTIPAALRGADPDSFAQHTMCVRLPNIARRVSVENDWSPETLVRLHELIDDMPQGALRQLKDDEAPDIKLWALFIEPYLGQNWLQTPWFVAEMYFFRRILEATGYYQPGEGYRVDPYAHQKRQGIVPVEQSLKNLLEKIHRLQTMKRQSLQVDQEILVLLFHSGVWANQADLSLWPATNGKLTYQPDTAPKKDQLLVDDAFSASQYVTSLNKNSVRIDLILDNCGLELAHDLSLADFLLTSQLANVITLHAKPHPTYVSDATIADIQAMIAHLAATSTQTIQQMASRLYSALDTGRLHLVDNYYWTSPLSGWEMPAELHHELSKPDLVINKGDANYRRWLGDRHWPHDTILEQILNYLPAPWLALRVLKANIIAGLQPGQAQEMDRLDPQWLYNGKWGIIQFMPPSRFALQYQETYH